MTPAIALGDGVHMDAGQLPTVTMKTYRLTFENGATLDRDGVDYIKTGDKAEIFQPSGGSWIFFNVRKVEEVTG